MVNNSKQINTSFFINTNRNKMFDYGIERLKQIEQKKQEIEDIENIEYLEDKLRSKNFIKLNHKWLKGIMTNNE